MVPGAGQGEGLRAAHFYQTVWFSPQKVLPESQIDENFKQLFRQLAGPVRGGPGPVMGVWAG